MAGKLIGENGYLETRCSLSLLLFNIVLEVLDNTVRQRNKS